MHLSFLAVLVAAAIVVIALFIVLPSYRNIVAIEREIATSKAQMEQEYQRTRFLRRSLQELEVVKQETQRFAESAFPRGSELSVVSTLQRLAEERGLVQEVRVLSEDATGQLRLSFVHTGSFADHVAYLRALEQLPYYVILPRLTWQMTGTQEDGTPILRLSFDARIYAREEKK